MNQNNLYNKRSWHHDYYKPFIYHIILKKKEKAPDFGYLRGNVKIKPGEPGSAYVFLSPLGKAIVEGFKYFEQSFPIFEKFRHCIMPDHIHIILYKKERNEYHLDRYIDNLKEAFICSFNFSNKTSFKHEDIFIEGYTDKPLYDKVKLDSWFTYLNENPYRRLMIMRYPNFFKRKRYLTINGIKVETYGNLFLLRNPDRMAVRIRRRFTKEEKNNHFIKAVEMGGKGSILVSPFISKEEKRIRYEAEKAGAKIILIKHEKFRDKYKPTKHDFYLCSEGRLLIISLGMKSKTPLTYQISTHMNEFASLIANDFTCDMRLISHLGHKTD